MRYTELQQKMLAVIRERNDWMTANQIAEAIGRKDGKPIPTDYKHLEIIAESGAIEHSYKIEGVVKKIHLYRAVIT